MGFVLGVEHSIYLDKCTTCIQQCSVIHSTFIALTVLCALPLCLSVPYPPPMGKLSSTKLVPGAKKVEDLLVYKDGVITTISGGEI